MKETLRTIINSGATSEWQLFHVMDIPVYVKIVEGYPCVCIGYVIDNMKVHDHLHGNFKWYVSCHVNIKRRDIISILDQLFEPHIVQQLINENKSIIGPENLFTNVALVLLSPFM